MNKNIIVVDADPKGRRELSNILKSRNYLNIEVPALSSLAEHLATGKFLAVILDIDSVPVDNRSIRDMTLKYPGVRFLCTSKDRFHPELKDAICYHIYACLNKPVDPDELLYWIKSIYEEEEIPDS